jgi:predicted transcriptional regulator
MTPNQRVAELRKIMRKRSLTAKDVAEILAYTPQAVRCWLRGDRNIPENTLSLLTMLLDRE